MGGNKRNQKPMSDKSKSDRMMEVVIKRASFYRANPHRFVKDFMGINLKLFQKILLYAMMVYNYFFFVAVRGGGKTYLVALYACVRCILYPGSKILVFSYTFKQGKETILKITDDFMHKSTLLCNEIKKASTGLNDCGVWFKNGSWIQVRVASETSRGARANVIIVDESRLVSRNIVRTVIRPMNAAPRTPGYLRKEQYKHLQEPNKELYMTSAWYKSSDAYEQLKSYVANMLDDKRKYFVCDLPYMLSIKEGLLMRESIENIMSESTFSDISFSMEYCGEFYGSSEDALFKFETLNSQRVLKESLMDLDIYRETSNIMPKKQVNEKRILSLDIALLASRSHSNDASCFLINQCVNSNEDTYISNYTRIETKEGLLTEELGLLAMRYFYQYDCDYFAIDCTGIGQSVLDYVMQDRFDPEYNITYTGMSCLNNDDLNIRCKSKNPNKCIYAIKASAKMNNDMILSLRSQFMNGNINLLCDETDIEEELPKLLKAYNKLSETQKAKLKLPYYQTTAMIEEMINLDHDISNNLIKVKEKSGMRKDRYSSILYNNYVVDQIRQNSKRNTTTKDQIRKMLYVKAPVSSRRYS